MTLTDRDKKIVIALVPLLLIAGYWFLLLGPKRDESAKVGEELTQAQTDRDAAVARAQSVSSAKGDFAADFAEVLRVGKAIPSNVDMPSLIVQLDEAADGTGIGFNSIKAGQRTTAQPLPPGAPPTTGSEPPTAAGGESASSAPGQAAEAANEASETSDEANAAAGADPADPSAGAAAGGTAPGLDSVPLDFTFSGDFFELADFFHKLKRFVHVNGGERIVVGGRLMTIDSFTFTMKDFPTLEATMTSTVYLSPLAEGATAGATPAGPGTATPAGGSAPAPAPVPASSPTQ
jgi:hypothetical protein